MKKKLKVRAARPGLKVPMEANHRRYIEQDPVQVPDSQYYRRSLGRGELVLGDEA